MYHLKGLLKNGMIEKVNREYRLTSKGLQFVGTLSLETGKTRKQPKILTAVICKNEMGEYLFSRWHRQPNIGLISFPHGMLHLGESVRDAAARELAEKTELLAELRHFGEVYVRGFRGETLDRHMLVHLFVADHPRSSAKKELRLEVSEPFWAKLEDIPPKDFIPGFYEIAQLVEAYPRGGIFEDLSVAIKD